MSISYAKSVNENKFKAVTSVRSPKMKRDASVKVVFFLSKKTTFTEASLFIFGQRTDVTALICMTKYCGLFFCLCFHINMICYQEAVLQ